MSQLRCSEYIMQIIPDDQQYRDGKSCLSNRNRHDWEHKLTKFSFRQHYTIFSNQLHLKSIEGIKSLNQ